MLALLHYPRLDPVIVHLGPIAIRWYGVAYMLGFILGYQLLIRLIRRGFLKITAEQLGDLMTWLIVGVLLGGRSGWWIFYHRATGVPEPWWEPVAMWHGGMSFHGGLLGVILVLILWTRYHRIAFWNVADALALVTPIGLFFGRCANFINAELVGRPSNLPWAMIFPNDTVARHPSQLYEALLEGPVLMSVLWLSRRKLDRRSGAIAALFVIGYGIIRFSVEFTREPDAQLGFIAFGWLTMGQLLSAAMAVVGVVLLIYQLRRPPTDPAPEPMPPALPVTAASDKQS